MFPAGAAPHSDKAALEGVGHANATGREQLHKGWARGMLEGALQPGVDSTGAAWLRTWEPQRQQGLQQLQLSPGD